MRRWRKRWRRCPSVTRAALVGSYVEETPQAELAARLGLSEGALRVRLHRGRMALRQALIPLVTPTHRVAGRRRASGVRSVAGGGWNTVGESTSSYSFRCSGPCASESTMLGSAIGSPLLTQFNSPKSLLARHCLNLGPLYRDALISGSGVCPRCGREIVAGQWLPG